MQTASQNLHNSPKGSASHQAAPSTFSKDAGSAFNPVTIGDQIIRLASSKAEVDEAQRLRYRVFYGEMGANPAPDVKAAQRDFDHFDSTCDHLIVIDQSLPQDPRVVGTYRFMRQIHARKAGGYYSAGEYDVTPLNVNGGAVMELGRSCVDPAFRNRYTMQLLWRGIAEYVRAYNIDLMFGCASFAGTDADALAQPLSYLHHNHLAPEPLRAKALPQRFSTMALLPKDAIDRKQALALMPPLIKGYLRLGAYVGEGAVVDHQFNTTDVCIIVKTDQMTKRYARRYALDGSHSSADEPGDSDRDQPARQVS